MKHLTFWAYLWHSDEFVSLVNRMVVLASGSAGGWAVARGYLSGEMASMLGVLALVVSHKFSQWNRGRAAAKAAGDVAGVAAMAGGADGDPTPSEDAPFVVGRSRVPELVVDERWDGTGAPLIRNESSELIRPGTLVQFGTCVVCGKPTAFAAEKGDPKFCSRACWAREEADCKSQISKVKGVALSGAESSGGMSEADFKSQISKVKEDAPAGEADLKSQVSDVKGPAS